MDRTRIHCALWGGLEAIQRWRKTLLSIGEQEMLHLALVQNLLTAVGAAPRLARPNFPMPAYAYPAGVRIELLPFGEAALRHFAFLERPEGMDVADAEGFEAIEQAVALPHDETDEIVPHLEEFDTIGQLYRSIRAGLEDLQDRLGAERLFIGPENAQATAEHFRWDELVAVTDLASARQAIDTIVEQGEGALGEWRNAHFGRLLAVLDEYLALKTADPGFEPARPVVAANVRPQATGVAMPLITDPGTTRAMDLLNVTYEVLLQLLSRYFAHADEELLVVLQCEHIAAVENADAIFSVPGIDAIFVGPNDLAASMRGKDGRPPSAEATNQAMKHILETCHKHKVAPDAAQRLPGDTAAH